jgi:hypothetical protein
MVATSALRPESRSGGYPLPLNRDQRYRLAIVALLGLVLVFAGGASRHDESQQVFVRLSAIAAIAASLWPLDFDRVRAHRRWITGVVAAYALLLLQLVPLPPAFWAQLPGHSLYAQVAQEAGAVVWRPLSLTPDLTLNSLFALLPATAAGLGTLHLGSRGRRRLAQWIVAAALLSGVFGLVQLGAGGNALHLYRESSSDSAIGLFANRNHQAAFLACGLPLIGAIAGLRLRDHGNPRLVATSSLSVAAFLLFALVSTGSRMGLILGMIGALGGIWCYWASGHRLVQARLGTWAAIAFAFAALLAAIAVAAVRVGVLERLAFTDAATETRAEMLDPLLRTAQAFMPLGAGFGSFDTVYRQFEPDALLSTIYMNHAHNEPMQLAIEGGLPALVLLGLFLWWWVRTAMRVVRADIPFKRRAMATAAVVITAILMASSLVDYPLRTPLLGAIFAVACAEMMLTAAAGTRRSLSNASDAQTLYGPPALTPSGWRARLAPGWLLRALLARRGAILTPLMVGWRRELEVLRETRVQVPLLMSDAAALQIQICVRAARHLNGHMAELGVLMGGSARLICEAKGDVPLHLFDVFETLQSSTSLPEGAREDEIRSHFGSVHGDRAEVERLLARYPGVFIHPGVFPGSVASNLNDMRFSFVHLDVDLPGSIEDGLAFFHPRMVPGGIMIGDDYNDRGVRETFATFFEPFGDTIIELPWGQVMVVKCS